MRRVGSGRVVYLGIAGGQALSDAVVAGLCALAHVQPLLGTPAGIEAAERRDVHRRILFLLNHGTASRRIRLGPGQFSDCVAGEGLIRGSVRLAPRGTLVLERISR